MMCVRTGISATPPYTRVGGWHAAFTIEAIEVKVLKISPNSCELVRATAACGHTHRHEALRPGVGWDQGSRQGYKF